MRGKARHFPTQAAPVEASVGITAQEMAITLLLLLRLLLLIPPLARPTVEESSALPPSRSTSQAAL